MAKSSTRQSPQPEHLHWEEQALLEVSPEARAARRTKKLAERVLATDQRLRGRRRPEYDNSNQLPFPAPEAISNVTVYKLAITLKNKQPIFDDFNDHHRVDPNPVSVELYCSATAKKRIVRRSDDVALNAVIKQASIRQQHHIADGLEQGVHDDLYIARLRHESLKTTQYLLRNDKPLDPQAAVGATDAIEDFGYGLSAQRDILKAMKDEDLGFRIATIGRQAAKDPQVLGQNQDLLRLVQQEQTARINYWELRDTFLMGFLGDRLTNQIRLDAAATEQEIARMAALREQ
ncbi:MAG: hypothetical protein JWS12_220 [Candidatus Saccharibacteria bacterium]|nr:hypothetical protein [Candidatus Saccharibacteria bacterium]